MRITVFTSNQPRHIALIARLAEFSSVYAVQECTTLFPGECEGFYKKSPVMQRYFREVLRAQHEVFGSCRFLPKGVRSMPMALGDVSKLPLHAFGPALDADHVVVFGASYIKGPLIDTLIEMNAINIHMGISPEYRGANCNFWAQYDGHPELVGGTIHYLTKGLDSGPVLMKAFPVDHADPFVHGMYAVHATQCRLASMLEAGIVPPPVPQDKSLEIRNARYEDFTDEVAEEYLDRLALGHLTSEKRGSP